MARRNDALATQLDVDPGAVALHARNVQFKWGTTPLHWISGEPIASHVISSINLLLPEGERWFCTTFNEALPLIKDVKLLEDVRGFIGQEAMHAETHNVVVHEFLGAHGIDPDPFIRQSEYLFRKALGPREAGSPRGHRQQLLERLALIGAIEHLTAFLGDWILNAPMEKFDTDPEMLDLFRWHGAEEVEHRNVAHDVTLYFDVGYGRRMLSMAVSYIGVILLISRGAKFLVHADPSMPNYGYTRLWIGFFGAMRRGALPNIFQLVGGAARYMKRSYTPEAEGNTAQAVAYLAKSPAAKAAAK